MQIKRTEFIKSYASAKELLKEDYPVQICFAGRSNAGKSTLINMITGTSLAKTSSLPGRTRLLNAFKVNDGQFYLIDLPGYGYSKASKAQTQGWQSLIEEYLNAGEKIKRVFVVVDCRVDSPLDKQLLEYLYFHRISFSVIATKADKLAKSQLNNRMIQLAAFFKIGRDDIIPVSHKGYGRDALLLMLEKILIGE